MHAYDNNAMEEADYINNSLVKMLDNKTCVFVDYVLGRARK
jgi:hypothetical protein